MTNANTNTPNQKINISVVLEYQWTSTRDLIENVEVDQITEVSSGTATGMQTPSNYKQDEEAKQQDYLVTDEARTNVIEE